MSKVTELRNMSAEHIKNNISVHTWCWSCIQCFTDIHQRPRKKSALAVYSWYSFLQTLIIVQLLLKFWTALLLLVMWFFLHCINLILFCNFKVICNYKFSVKLHMSTYDTISSLFIYINIILPKCNIIVGSIMMPFIHFYFVNLVTISTAKMCCTYS